MGSNPVSIVLILSSKEWGKSGASCTPFHALSMPSYGKYLFVEKALQPLSIGL
jgi:hypothetical protein